MNWLNRAELKYGHLAIPGLVRIIVVLNALVYILYKVSPDYLLFLDLRPDLILQGQVWRLVSYLFIPRFGGFYPEPLNLVVYLVALDIMGRILEHAMGPFRLNVFYLLGMAGITAAAFFFGPAYSAGLLSTSLLFALSYYAPDTIIYVLYILPVKIRWIAWVAAFWIVVGFISRGWEYRAATLVCLANYLCFFGAHHVQQARRRAQVTSRRMEFQAKVREGKLTTLHECVVCQRTENSDRYLDFRVAADGQEYCVDHLPSASSPSA